MKEQAFRVPADLRPLTHLSMQTVIDVIINRRRQKVLENRIIQLPLKVLALKDELAEVKAKEAELLKEAPTDG